MSGIIIALHILASYLTLIVSSYKTLASSYPSQYPYIKPRVPRRAARHGLALSGKLKRLQDADAAFALRFYYVVTQSLLIINLAHNAQSVSFASS